ncbi:MAG: cobalt ECF transporter T component CbiQ [Burkholderiaceae bacterium]|nr:cobalt ECF transporter T component CbiQ [Burkholderiaceae bacterium]
MKQIFATASLNAPISRISPASRFVASLMFALTISVVNCIQVAFVALVFAFLTVWFAKPPKIALLKRFLAINVFVLFIWLITPWTTPGESLWTIGPFHITDSGVLMALLVSMKVNTLFFFFILCISSQSFTEVSASLTKLRFPDKLSALILFTVRGISIFEEQFKCLQEAVKLRGFKAGSNFRTWKIQASLIAIVFVRAFKRAEIMQQAMLLRGFNGKIHVLKVAPWHTIDTIFVLVMALICFLFVFWSYY